jgi:hypothetical protein
VDAGDGTAHIVPITYGYVIGSAIKLIPITGTKPEIGARYSYDIGCERFLALEVFFNPEIYSSDYITPCLLW